MVARPLPGHLTANGSDSNAPEPLCERRNAPELSILLNQTMIKHHLFAYSCLQPGGRKTQNLHLVPESLRAIAKSPLRRLESTRQPRHRPHTGNDARSKYIRAADSRGGKHITGTAHRTRAHPRLLRTGEEARTRLLSPHGHAFPLLHS